MASRVLLGVTRLAVSSSARHGSTENSEMEWKMEFGDVFGVGGHRRAGLAKPETLFGWEA